MSEYIRREDAIDAVNHALDRETILFSFVRNVAISALKKLPSADVVQVVHARWVNYSPVTIKCSQCGHVIHDWRYSECKYCPNCGARMDGEE